MAESEAAKAVTEIFCISPLGQSMSAKEATEAIQRLLDERDAEIEEATEERDEYREQVEMMSGAHNEHKIKTDELIDLLKQQLAKATNQD